MTIKEKYENNLKFLLGISAGIYIMTHMNLCTKSNMSITISKH